MITPGPVLPPSWTKSWPELGSLGYRDTEPRRLVISAVAAQGRPFTAEDLCAALPCVGRATVYRGLRLLVETDQVCRVLLEDRELRYQLSHQGHHHHMLCAVCGASIDLAGCDVEDTLRTAAAASAGFRMSGHWLEVYGCLRRLRPRLDPGRCGRLVNFSVASSLNPSS